ncbi:DUF2848 domain-containing protein [Hoyosella sp. YIM 151337]|uniref:DUF2848 domain-containing protein n=1 Tax=Hoyosella sp. YIM 151337 TaxID=2992742 RepID=UPI002236081E|nr:DUF2848 domain-containing protein [Hoyosella sp. YIM 151337]MCW4354128.1 DUF2848 domain-containing protein [Hoyosella sp. YIM 151337]
MTQTTISTLSLGVVTLDGPVKLHDAHALIAGYTGRDEAAVQHHIDELAAIGVAPPDQVPMFYPVSAQSVTTASHVPIGEPNTSGEVEPVIIRAGGSFYLGVGSDHTDRQLETIDIGDSKRACPKPLGRAIINIEDWNTFDWDACRARSWVDGTLYQDGTLAGLRSPQDLLQLREARVGDDGEDFILFAGTLPLLNGKFTPGRRWDLEIALPDGRTISHSYITEGE